MKYFTFAIAVYCVSSSYTSPHRPCITGLYDVLLIALFVVVGSLLDFLKEGDGKYLKLPVLVDMAAQVRTKHKSEQYLMGHFST